MEQLSRRRRCRAGYSFEWTGTALQEKAGGRADHDHPRRWRCCSPTCSWSALYESWTIPVPVLLSVAVGVLGAIGALSARRASTPTSMPRSASSC